MKCSYLTTVGSNVSAFVIHPDLRSIRVVTGVTLILIQKRNGERTLPPPPSQVVPAVISNVTSVRLRYLPRGDVCDTPHKDCTLAT